MTLSGNTAVPTVPAVAAPVASKKRGWLPLLTVLFLLSYGLMTMLIVEQGVTIDSQRLLIRELFRDSMELSSVKMKAGQERAAAADKSQYSVTQDPSSQGSTLGQTPSTQTRSSQTPSAQTQSTQAPSKQAPSSQAGPQHRTQNQTGKQKQFRMPSKPAADLADERRSLITI